MKKVVVVGAGGFIGRQLIKYLSSKKVLVIAMDIPNSKDNVPKTENVSFIPVDLSDRDSVIQKFQDVQADVCYHLAWAGVSTSEKNNIYLQTSNLTYLINILDACNKASCKNIIIPGSASQYAYCGKIIDGTNVPAPGDAYAATKSAAQILAQYYAVQNNLNIIWLLVGSIYGPGRNDNNIITYTIKKLLSGENTEYTKLEQMWDYIYIDDLINALYLIGTKGENNAVYPVGSGVPHQLFEYIEKIHQLISPKTSLGIGKLPYKNDSCPDNSILDISKLTQDTGFTPKISFEEGIRNTINYFKEISDNGII